MNRFQEKLVPDVQTRREKEKHEFKFIGSPLGSQSVSQALYVI